MRTSAGEVVGQVLVQHEPSAALFMTLPGWVDQIDRYGWPGDAYLVRIEREDQPPQLVTFDIEQDSSWSTTLDIDPDTITTVAVVDGDGNVWCEAQL